MSFLNGVVLSSQSYPQAVWLLQVDWLCDLEGKKKVNWFVVTSVCQGFPGGASGKELTCQCWKHEMGVQSLGLEDLLEEGMATHCSILAPRIPWTVEPGWLQSLGLQRVGHDWATSPSLFSFMHWRRKWQPTPVFLPGESQGRGSLVGCRLWGRTESDTTEAT